MYLSIATDWCNPFLIPHNHEGPKGWLAKRRPKVNLFGLVSMSHTTTHHLIYHMEFWKHSANLHISILYNHLRQLRKDGVLPPHLILQFDNCAKDNKNRWLFAFLAHLIHKGWCTSITIYYLMPGHSHDIVDSECFSPVGKKYRREHSVWTFTEFPGFLARAWRRRAHNPIISGDIVVYDWKGFFNSELRTIKHHSFPRAFLLKVALDADGDRKVGFFYKKSVLSPNWLGHKSK